MLDPNLLRKKPKIIEECLKKREEIEKLKELKQIIKKDREWRRLKIKIDELRQKRNQLSLKINEYKKAGKDLKDLKELLKKAKELPPKIAQEEEKAKQLKKEIDSYLQSLPNIPAASVPLGEDETKNKEIKKWGKIPQFNFKIKNHPQLLEELGLADFERSAKISGTGFYFLKGDLVLVEQALLRFALEKLRKKGYQPIYPPLMMRRKPYQGVTDLSAFKTTMYKIEKEDEYLIATSEHPLIAQFMDEILTEKELPLKFCGLSPCFRKEIGSHGIDEKGIFRTHQFNKIEQIIICKPEDSWRFHKELLQNMEEIFQSLEIPYRIVNLCTGDLGITAAQTYDLEAWLPYQKKYREMGSCSQCTDYQARRLKIRFRDKKGKIHFVHTLNSTAITTRALIALLENFQQKDGSVKLPSSLEPYLHIKKLVKKPSQNKTTKK